MTKPNDKVTLQDIQNTAERLKNWGRWGAGDEAGTLNNVSPQDIVNAGRLIRKGKVFSLAIRGCPMAAASQRSSRRAVLAA